LGACADLPTDHVGLGSVFPNPDSPDPVVLRNALRRWAFVPDRGDEMPPEVRAALAWLRRRSLPITALQDDKILRRVLDALAQKLDGIPSNDYLVDPISAGNYRKIAVFWLLLADPAY
jgi:hypothetical protein